MSRQNGCDRNMPSRGCGRRKRRRMRSEPSERLLQKYAEPELAQKKEKADEK